jgi:hypothetical protein
VVKREGVAGEIARRRVLCPWVIERRQVFRHDHPSFILQGSSELATRGQRLELLTELGNPHPKEPGTTLGSGQHLYTTNILKAPIAIQLPWKRRPDSNDHLHGRTSVTSLWRHLI